MSLFDPVLGLLQWNTNSRTLQTLNKKKYVKIKKKIKKKLLLNPLKSNLSIFCIFQRLFKKKKISQH